MVLPLNRRYADIFASNQYYVPLKSIDSFFADFIAEVTNHHHRQHIQYMSVMGI